MMKFKKAKHEEQTNVRNARNQAGRAAPVFSYYSSRSQEVSGSFARSRPIDSLKLKNSSPWIKYIPSFVSLVLVLAAGVYITTLSTQPRISIVKGPNQPVVMQSLEVYERATKEILESSPANRSKLTINTSEIATTLKARFPELGDLVVAIPLFGRRPSIEVRPAIPTLILAGNGGSFVIDTSGIAVLKASQLTSSIRDPLPVVSDNADTTIELGKQIVTRDLVSFISNLEGYLRVMDIQIESFTLPALANEIHVKPAGKGYFIKFNTEADARQQVGAYVAVQDLLDKDNQTPTEYIDVRVEERIYIK